MEELPLTNPQAPLPPARRLGAPLCWIFFAIGTMLSVFVIAILTHMFLDESSTGPGGWAYVFTLMLFWPIAWGFALAGFVTALDRISKIKRYNRESGTSEPGIVSATVCATLSATEAFAPLLFVGAGAVQTIWHYTFYGVIGWW